MVKTIKKVFSSFVAMMTVVSSVGFGSLGFANVATAATLVSGDLIKASGPAVYYYGADGKRYVFPNEKTYMTWYSDFSSVKTITDDELAAISIGGNATYKPGVKMVKITTDPKVYAVDQGGSLRWIESEAVASALYGSAWNKVIDDVPDAFFVNYTVGTSIAVASSFDKAAVSAAATSINQDKGLSPVVPVSGAVTVTLASDTPAGVTVPRNAASIPLAKFTFTSNGGAATVESLVLHRVGVGATTDFSNIYLYNVDGLRLTTGRTVNASSQNATFNNVNIAVPANGSASVVVYGDMSSPTVTGGQHAFEILEASAVTLKGGAAAAGVFPVRANTFTVGTTLAGRLDVTRGSTPGNPNVGSKDVEISNFRLTANTNDIKVNQITLYQAGTVTNADLSNLKLYQGTTLMASAASVSSDGRIVLKFTTPYTIANGTTRIFSLKADIAGRSNRSIRTYVEYTTDVNATDAVYNSGAAVDISTNGNMDGTGFTAGTTGCDTPGNSMCVVTQGGTLTNAFNGPATSNIARGQLGVELYKFSLTAENALEIRNLRFSLGVTSGSPAACMLRGTGTAAAFDGTMYFRNIKVKNLDTGKSVMGPTEIPSTLADTSDNSSFVLSESFNIAAGQTLNLAIAADVANNEDNAGELYGNGNCGYQVTLSAFQSNDIRLIDTGEYLDLTKVVPNTAVTGNAQTVKASSLAISLAGSPSSGTLVKKQQNVPIAGIVLTSGAQSDILVTSMTLTCQAALATSGVVFGDLLARANCDERITSLSLWNGPTQVGVAKAPDTTTGAAQISNTNLTVPAGQSVNLTVKASFGSTASTTAPYDRVSVGVAAPTDVSAQDKDSNTVSPSLATGLTANANGAAPAVIQTIRNNGVIAYATASHPASTLVVAGKDVWVPFAAYTATAQFEAVDLDRIALFAPSSTSGITHNTDNAVYTAIAVASGGAVKGQDILAAGTTGTKDIDITANKITVPKDSSVNFEIWAKLSSIVASSTNPAPSGLHRSGMQPYLGINSGLTTGEWDGNYFLSANIRATGQASGERVYASSTNATPSNRMVTRKSKPTVTKQSLSSLTLANADKDLYKFQIAADAQGSVAVKQIVFTFTKTSSTAGVSPLTFSNFRLRKGADDIDTANIAISFVPSTGGAAVDVETGSVGVNQNTGFIVVSFVDKETITGSGNVYTLHATASNVPSSGSSVTVGFMRDSAATVATGYLQRNVAWGLFNASADVYHIDTAAAGDNAANATGTFLWSDMSEVPNNATASSTAGGSRDWTNDVYVQDLSQGETVSN